MGDDVKDDVLEAVQKQVSTRNRLREMQLHNMVTAQGSEAEMKKKVISKMKTKKQSAMLRKAMLEKAGKKDLHEMQHNKKSVAEILNSIVADVQQKSKRRLGRPKLQPRKRPWDPK